MNDWITEHYERLLTICRNVSKEYYCNDLFQSCMEQFLSNEKSKSIPEEDRFYFFTRIVYNNFNSSTSPYAQTYKKYKFVELTGDRADKVEEVEIDLSWVKKELDKMKVTDWYYGRLFELYIEEGCSIKKLSERTTIPMNSVSRDINKVRRTLVQRKIKYYEDGL